MKQKILVVDDERHIVRLLQANLERAGYEVVTAYDGVEALEKVRAEHPDMILLDIMMPRMDGYQVLRTLLADQRYCHIPVIVVTGKAQDADIFKGWASGAASYLTKPLDIREILTHVFRIFQTMDEPDPIEPGTI